MLIHKPVLLQEVLESVSSDTKIFVDCTLGHGGHTLEIIKKIGPQLKVIGIDLDQQMLNKAEEILQNFKDQIKFVHGSYSDIDQILIQNGYQKADFILVDLGVNLQHFKDFSRGFSIKLDGDLDMRFDKNQKLTAYDILNSYSIKQLQEIFISYAQFTPKKSLEIAQTIITERKKNPIKTTFNFKNLLKLCGLGEKACAVIFQSIRIQTNQEIQNLQILLQKLPKILNSRGKCVILSYHSIEDKLVKENFKNLVGDGQFKLVNKKAVKTNYKEIEINRASRSAKLRIIQKK
ncbi:MAG: 16S rRNA (cytosine(1402)-N(4))-methyltransferase RsmH [Candidatus Absconditabacterales bacterium]